MALTIYGSPSLINYDPNLPMGTIKGIISAYEDSAYVAHLCGYTIIQSNCHGHCVGGGFTVRPVSRTTSSSLSITAHYKGMMATTSIALFPDPTVPLRVKVWLRQL